MSVFIRHSSNALLAKVLELSADSLETIAETILDLEADLEEKADECEKLREMVADLEAAQ